MTLPSSELLVLISYFSGVRLTFRTPDGPFSSLSVGKSDIFGRYYLTGSLNCEPSVPTSQSTLERATRLDFGFFRGRVHVLDPRRAVFEPKCWKIGRFRPLLSYRKSELRAVSSYKSRYPRASCSSWFRIFSGSGSRFGPPAGRFRA